MEMYSLCTALYILMIIVVSALCFPRYCLTTDQLVYRRATQTTEINTANET